MSSLLTLAMRARTRVSPRSDDCHPFVTVRCWILAEVLSEGAMAPQPEQSGRGAADLLYGWRDGDGHSSRDPEKRHEEYRCEQGSTGIAEQHVGIAESHNATAGDGRCSSLANCSRHVLNCGCRASLLIWNMVHEKAVDAGAGHPLHAAVGEIVSDGERNTARKAHTEESCGSRGLGKPDSKYSSESSIQRSE